jgi:hypothetical protein
VQKRSLEHLSAAVQQKRGMSGSTCSFSSCKQGSARKMLYAEIVSQHTAPLYSSGGIFYPFSIKKFLKTFILNIFMMNM